VRITYKVRVRIPQTKIGLKKKLRNDLWSDPVEITKIHSNQNVEVATKKGSKVLNVNNVKLKEPDRGLNLEKIRHQPTVTKFGRISKPCFKNL
jgi:hypothetical protein